MIASQFKNIKKLAVLLGSEAKQVYLGVLSALQSSIQINKRSDIAKESFAL